MKFIWFISLLALAIQDANSGGPTFIDPSEKPLVPSSFQVTTTVSPTLTTQSPIIVSTKTPTDFPIYDYYDLTTDFPLFTGTEQEGFSSTKRMNQSGRSRRTSTTVIPTTLDVSEATDKITEVIFEQVTEAKKVTEATKASEKVTEATKSTDKITVAIKPTDKVTEATKVTNKITVATAKVTEPIKPTDKITVATKVTLKPTIATKATDKTTVTAKVTQKVTEATKALTTLLTLSTNLSDAPIPPPCVFDDNGDFTSPNKVCLRDCPERFIKLDYPDFCCFYLVDGGGDSFRDEVPNNSMAPRDFSDDSDVGTGFGHQMSRISSQMNPSPSVEIEDPSSSVECPYKNANPSPTTENSGPSSGTKIRTPSIGSKTVKKSRVHNKSEHHLIKIVKKNGENLNLMEVGPSKGTPKGASKGNSKGTSKGTPKSTPKGTRKGAPKSTPKGSSKGTTKGTPERTKKITKKSSNIKVTTKIPKSKASPSPSTKSGMKSKPQM
ncbi:unnamed protein product [Diamesa tonsa]